MIHLVLFIVLFVGFATLLSAQPRHQTNWMGRRFSSGVGTVLRWLGLLTLLLAFVISGRVLTWSYGAVVWFGWMTVSAGAVVCLNTGRQHMRLSTKKAAEKPVSRRN